MGGVTGAKSAFSAETLEALYPYHAGYVAKFSAAADRLVTGRWISRDDADATKNAASAAPIAE